MITNQTGASESERNIEIEREIETENDRESDSIGSNDAQTHNIIPSRTNIFS